MPSAATAICVQCAQPAKYTCPACAARTCSLACTRAHKAADPGGCAGSTGSSNTSWSSAASSSTASTSANAAHTYVPLTQYTEAHLMADFHFLSSISRTTAETGRNIVSLNLVPASSSPSTRQTNQQRQREQLVKQLHYRRLRVMVLPEGMARRKTNLSAFQPRDKRFVLTVELALGGAKTLLHRQDAGATVEDVVLGELQHRSFANRKEAQRVRGALPDSSTAARMWIVSKTVLQQTQLPVPSATVPAGEDGEYVALHAFPKEWAVLVPAYSARLTNESTTRYLEWWTRKRRWEEANPELAAQQKRDEEEGAKRARGGWRGEGEVEGRGRVDEVQAEEEGGLETGAGAAAQVTTVDGAAGASSHGIISPSLLSILSQRLGRNTAPAPPSLSTPPTAQRSSSNQPASPTTTSDDASSLLLTLPHPHRTTLSWLLQTIPEGFAVVEYPELRVVCASDASPAGAKIVTLAGEGVDGDAEQSGADNGAGEGGEPVVVEVAATSGSLGGLLARYDSESDADSVEQTVDVGDAEEDVQQEGATLASLALQHGFLAAPSSSS
ncbi:uncharacterized protein SRS1_13123 [Sporisorium reilianum f. sp. reilianum]|uniref:HIT-type domain-containing protein n=1 Tax=Sporisorium reilianum f. sp. reilianum TaxID=72559 RepID=A0A2N8UB84_9BASI|nr:uncharacterized protein SRS1_13123 [Sporisorium reilianum f. sp. reilianum]